MTKAAVAKNWVLTAYDGVYYSDNQDPGLQGGLYYAGPVLGPLTPTIYAATADAGTGDGSSEANAMAFADALVAVAPGGVIGMLPGVYSAASGGTRFTAAHRVTHAGSSGTPIRIVAKYSAVDLAGKAGNARWASSDVDAVFAHANRTELRHTGGTSPAFGCTDKTNVHWFGQCVDEVNAAPRADTGPAILVGATNCSVNRAVLRGRPVPAGWLTDNHPGVRLENSTDCTVSDCVITGFRYYDTSSEGGHNHCGVQRYDCVGTVIQNCHTFGNHTGVYLKDTSTARDEIVRYNLCSDVFQGIEVLNCNISSSDLSEVYQNLVIAPSGFVMQADGYNIRGRNNTIIASDIAVSAHFAMTGCDLLNNILVATGGSNRLIDQQFRTAAIVPSNYNRWHVSSGSPNARYNSSSYSSLAAWQSGTSQDANSSIGDPAFVNAAGDDYHLAVGSPCLTMSSTSGPVGCYITGSETVGPRYAV